MRRSNKDSHPKYGIFRNNPWTPPIKARVRYAGIRDIELYPEEISELEPESCGAGTGPMRSVDQQFSLPGTAAYRCTANPQPPHRHICSR